MGNMAPRQSPVYHTPLVGGFSSTLLKEILGGKGARPMVVDAVYGRIAAALEREG